MGLLSRSFFRKRIISLATTLSVTAVSFAMAQNPTNLQRSHNAAADDDEQQFLLDNDLALSNVSNSMLVKASGDVDRDFVAMMIPHHQGAIDIAQAELKYGHNPELRLLAQSIVTQQRNEISEMQRAIEEMPEASSVGAPAPKSGTNGGLSPTPAAMHPQNVN